MQLSSLIFLTGGILNPFSIFLIIPSVFSSSNIELKASLTLIFLTVLSILLLTFYHVELIYPETNKILVKQSILQAQMGCDVLAPSDMMDGRIGEIRKSLDKSGFKMTQILSYAIKYSSNFYFLQILPS